MSVIMEQENQKLKSDQQKLILEKAKEQVTKKRRNSNQLDSHFLALAAEMKIGLQ